MENLTEDEELAKINMAIAERKAQLNKDVVIIENEKNTNVMEVVKEQEKQLLQTEAVVNFSKKISEEKIKADILEEAVKIQAKNITTAENEFKNETRALKLSNLKAELKLQHKYNMDNIKKNAEFKQMLAKRKKLVIKYSYLYDCKPENCITLKDDEDNEYLAPKDFSFSTTVNVIRQCGRNISKLDRPILQGLKWTITIGIFVGGYLILKKLGVI